MTASPPSASIGPNAPIGHRNSADLALRRDPRFHVRSALSQRFERKRCLARGALPQMGSNPPFLSVSFQEIIRISIAERDRRTLANRVHRSEEVVNRSGVLSRFGRD